jgi:hypothetical protein
MHEAVIAAVERVMRERFAASVPLEDDDDEWRREAEAAADAALAAIRPGAAT